ncbi:hypothetical protein Csa_015334 [Cucumis sativus]|nr:hypothetical protein Csa_015334 [Cucumis sativus]
MCGRIGSRLASTESETVVKIASVLAFLQISDLSTCTTSINLKTAQSICSSVYPNLDSCSPLSKTKEHKLDSQLSLMILCFIKPIDSH